MRKKVGQASRLPVSSEAASVIKSPETPMLAPVGARGQAGRLPYFVSR